MTHHDANDSVTCTNQLTITAIHIPTSTGTLRVQFKKNGVNWSSPTNVSQAYFKNTASGVEYDLSAVSGYTGRYGADNIPYGDYQIYVPTGNGTAVTLWNTVTLDASNKTFYADYYTLTYAANGGSGTLPATVTRLKGQSVAVANKGNLSRTNHEFTGWATSSSGTATVQPGASHTFTAQTTLYAVWKPYLTPTVTVLKNGGTFANCYYSMQLEDSTSGDVYYLYRQSGTTSCTYATDTPIPQSTYDIYVMNSDWGALQKTGTFTLSDSSTAATVAYFTVRFMSADISYTVEKTIAANTEVQVPLGADMSRPGYTFCYWMDNNNIITPGSTKTITFIKTYTAYWYPGNYALGDVDEDGAITSTDGRLISQYVMGKLTANDLNVDLADYDQDDAVTSTDSRLVLQAAVGKALAANGGMMLNSTGRPITWSDLDWSRLDMDAIDWDTFTIQSLIDMLTAGNTTPHPDHEIM